MTGERRASGLRPVRIHRHYLREPEGSVLFEMGNTRVICTATVEDKVPAWRKGSGEGWITAEYAMLPRATRQRKARESRVGRPDSRSLEISRMIGRALRGVVDLQALGEWTIILDCDVIQADGGTRTACITGGFVALYDALRFLKENQALERWPLREFLAAVSVGIVDGEIVVDLDYELDVRAEVDLNVAMTESGRIVEIQGTGEGRPFTRQELSTMLDRAWTAIQDLIQIQKEALGLS